jgi:hypothetical protein
MDLSLSDYVGTLMVNLSELRRIDYDAYLELSSEWLDLHTSNNDTIENVIALERRVIRACGRGRRNMTAQRLEELRALLADLYWEVSNNRRDMAAGDQSIGIDLAISLNKARHLTIELRDSARLREAGTR